MGAYKIISPWYIVGFTEGEGCFAIILSRHKTKKAKRDAGLCFEIELRGDDKPILERIQKRLGCGQIIDLEYERYGWKPHVKYVVRKQKDLFFKVIPFFKQFPLQGKKQKDFELFCQAAEIIKNREHLKDDGIKKLEKIREFMNERRPMFG
ncbi:MAG: LAGLIDADG family homing endonuclease [Patescibacteria group bacterium]